MAKTSNNLYWVMHGLIDRLSDQPNENLMSAHIEGLPFDVCTYRYIHSIIQLTSDSGNMISVLLTSSVLNVL